MEFAIVYYLLSLLDMVNFVAGLMSVLPICVAVGVIVAYDEDKLNKEQLNKSIKLLILMFMMAFSIATLMPDKKDAIIMVGLYYSQDTLVEVGAGVSNLPPKLIALIDSELSNFIKDAVVVKEEVEDK